MLTHIRELFKNNKPSFAYPAFNTRTSRRRWGLSKLPKHSMRRSSLRPAKER